MSEDTPPAPSVARGDARVPGEAAGGAPAPMTLSKLRHEIRNHLNAIKLCCALIHRQTSDAGARSTADEVDRAADRIADLVIHYMSDDEAARLFRKAPTPGRYEQ